MTYVTKAISIVTLVTKEKGTIKVRKNILLSSNETPNFKGTLLTKPYIFAAPSITEANKIIKTVKHYGFTNSCFVGRPNPNFSYQLVNGKASRVQPARGEDIIRFNPRKIEVKYANNHWKIVEGNHWMFDFGNKKDEAKKALCIIKKYGFNAIGYVGRPKASLQYMVKRN